MNTDTPFSSDEVRAWFAACIKQRPLPDAAAVAPLVRLANAHRLIARGQLPGNAEVLAAHGRLRAAVPHAVAARKELRGALAILDAIPDEHGDGPLAPEANALLTALDAFLLEERPRRRGRPSRPLWQHHAVLWAPTVRRVLVTAGWPADSTGRDDGAVCGVVARMIKETYGERIRPATIGRELRRAAGKSGRRKIG